MGNKTKQQAQPGQALKQPAAIKEVDISSYAGVEVVTKRTNQAYQGLTGVKEVIVPYDQTIKDRRLRLGGDDGAGGEIKTFRAKLKAATEAETTASGKLASERKILEKKVKDLEKKEDETKKRIDEAEKALYDEKVVVAELDSGLKSTKAAQKAIEEAEKKLEETKKKAQELAAEPGTVNTDTEELEKRINTLRKNEDELDQLPVKLKEAQDELKAQKKRLNPEDQKIYGQLSDKEKEGYVQQISRMEAAIEGINLRIAGSDAERKKYEAEIPRLAFQISVARQEKELQKLRDVAEHLEIIESIDKGLKAGNKILGDDQNRVFEAKRELEETTETLEKARKDASKRVDEQAAILKKAIDNHRLLGDMVSVTELYKDLDIAQELAKGNPESLAEIKKVAETLDPLALQEFINRLRNKAQDEYYELAISWASDTELSKLLEGGALAELAQYGNKGGRRVGNLIQKLAASMGESMGALTLDDQFVKTFVKLGDVDVEKLKKELARMQKALTMMWAMEAAQEAIKSDKHHNVIAAKEFLLKLTEEDLAKHGIEIIEPLQKPSAPPPRGGALQFTTSDYNKLFDETADAINALDKKSPTFKADYEKVNKTILALTASVSRWGSEQRLNELEAMMVYRAPKLGLKVGKVSISNILDIAKLPSGREDMGAWATADISAQAMPLPQELERGFGWNSEDWEFYKKLQQGVAITFLARMAPGTTSGARSRDAFRFEE